MQYYIIETKFRTPLPIPREEFVQQVIPQHVQYLERFIESGDILLTGPNAGENRGGYTILRAENREMLETFIAQDPLEPCAEYTVREFLPKDGYIRQTDWLQ